MIFIPVKDRVLIPVFLVAENHIQNTRDCCIQHPLGQLAALHCADNQSVVRTV